MNPTDALEWHYHDLVPDPAMRKALEDVILPANRHGRAIRLNERGIYDLCVELDKLGLTIAPKPSPHPRT